MTVSGHAIVGALIAITVKQPALVLPLALLSHYVLDTLPHFGYAGKGYAEALKHPITYVEQAASWAMFVVLALSLRHQSWLVYSAATLAVVPDLMWPYRYFFFERVGKVPPGGALTNFHRHIQWCEREWGVWVEIGFFALCYIALKGLVA
jgi:hypothetical protein